MFVSIASADHMVETHSSMGLVMASYVTMIVSPILLMCLRSILSPSIVRLMFMGSVMLSIHSSSCVLYSSGSGMKSVL